MLILPGGEPYLTSKIKRWWRGVCLRRRLRRLCRAGRQERRALRDREARRRLAGWAEGR